MRSARLMRWLALLGRGATVSRVGIDRHGLRMRSKSAGKRSGFDRYEAGPTAEQSFGEKGAVPTVELALGSRGARFQPTREGSLGGRLCARVCVCEVIHAWVSPTWLSLFALAGWPRHWGRVWF